MDRIKNQRHSFLKTLRILINISCIFAMLFVIYFCTTKYLDSPTTLSVKRIKIQDTIFPEFTICPLLGQGSGSQSVGNYLKRQLNF